MFWFLLSLLLHFTIEIRPQDSNQKSKVSNQYIYKLYIHIVILTYMTADQRLLQSKITFCPLENVGAFDIGLKIKWHCFVFSINGHQGINKSQLSFHNFFFVSWKTILVKTCCLSIIVKSAASPLKIQTFSTYINLRFICFAKFVIIPVNIVKNFSIILAKITMKWKFINVMFFVSSFCWFDKILR